MAAVRAAKAAASSFIVDSSREKEDCLLSVTIGKLSLPYPPPQPSQISQTFSSILMKVLLPTYTMCDSTYCTRYVVYIKV
jgi:hypothetical protein